MAAIVSPAQFDKFFTELDTRYFWTAYTVAPQWHTRVATIIPVGTEQWLGGWIGRLDKMREWLGSRVEHSPAPQTYGLTIQNWELTESIDRFKLADDTHGIYGPLIEAMGISTAKNQDYQLRDLWYNQGSQTGGRQTGPDVTPGFGSTHPVDFYDASKGTYVNDFRGGVSINSITVGGALTSPAYQTAWAEMTNRKSETGEPMGVMPDLFCCGPNLKFLATTLLQAEFLGLKAAYGATDNVGAFDNVANRGSSDMLIIPEFQTSTRQLDWLLLDTKRPLKPFIWLERAAPVLIPRVSPTDPVSFDRHAFLYGVESRGTPGWGASFLSSISGPT